MTTTPRKTTRKAAPKATGAEVVVKTDEQLEAEQSALEQEVAAETEGAGEKETPTFTIQLNGEDIEVEDRWDRPGKIPPISVMFSSDEMAAKMSTPIIVQLIGEDQLYNLIMLGLTQDEFVLVARAWMESRGLGK
ncbi:hypothetical protein [Corynebacterium glutamicum]|uniref:Tail assembly chaperone n=2 Tax=Corynebacterium glutamicum TaxID=1718 RepID=Q5KRJ4_CORGT|nr:hypothetical protein [Corynebacterium glutamicum]BAD84087.1 hypothetical protein [Corynebacterium glutamicum]BAF54879.1 hypothetical protein cgR_1884 [Corynebacterium glutamicum R]